MTVGKTMPASMLAEDLLRQRHSKEGGKIPIMEIFGPTFQGEGAMIGYRTHFIRTGGCPYRCKWCDSMHAVDPELVNKNAEWLTSRDILNRIDSLPGSAPWVTLTGGDPVMWDLTTIVTYLRDRGYKVTIETEGALFKFWLVLLQHVTVSPKGPSSGMDGRFDMGVINQYIGMIPGEMLTFKFVIFTKEDLDFALAIKERISKEYRQHLYRPSFYLSVGTPQGKPDRETKDDVLEATYQIAEDVLKDKRFHEFRLTPQLHVLVWGTKLGV